MIAKAVITLVIAGYYAGAYWAIDKFGMEPRCTAARLCPCCTVQMETTNDNR